jgi:D-alanyl-D-alanine carboxypeptidase
MKSIKSIICFILIAVLCTTAVSSVYASSPDTSTPDTSAPIAIVMDFNTGEILYERNMNQRWIPASMTKSMTAFIVYQEIEAGNLTLDTEIRVSEGASRFSNRRSVPGTFVPLPSGGLITVEILLRLMMIPSCNAAAVVFAEHISETEENFVIRMNETAAEMGMYTEFTNSHGAFVHYSNAYSMAVLVREFIMQYPDILRITSMSSVRFQGRTFRNTNLLISQNMMSDADGFKTGSLRQAGWNHSATAERNGRRIITVVMNTSSRSARQIESRRLLNYGFEEIERRETERINRARIFFDGELIPLTESPIINQGRLLLPIENVLEQLGYTVYRDEVHSLVLITHENGDTATLLTGRDLAVINGETRTLSMPAHVQDGIIYTSIEAIGAITGTLSQWSMETGVIRFRK